MKLTWLGHACFLLEQDGYRLVIDPYTEVVGHSDIQTEAHQVLCSHQHFDHNAVEGVALLPERESPFVIRTVETCHDEQGGALRGKNLIHIVTAGDVTVAHLGDLGHQLSAEQIEAVGKVDGVLVPIGGTYTLDAVGAKQVCDALAPRWVVPMHYRHGEYGFPVLLDVEAFAELWNGTHRLNGPTFEIKPDTAGVIVPEFC